MSQLVTVAPFWWMRGSWMAGRAESHSDAKAENFDQAKPTPEASLPRAKLPKMGGRSDNPLP